MTPLMHAAYKGDAESVEVLLTHGAEVNRKSTEHEVINSAKFITLPSNRLAMSFAVKTRLAGPRTVDFVKYILDDTFIYTLTHLSH